MKKPLVRCVALAALIASSFGLAIQSASPAHAHYPSWTDGSLRTPAIFWRIRQAHKGTSSKKLFVNVAAYDPWGSVYWDSINQNSTVTMGKTKTGNTGPYIYVEANNFGCISTASGCADFKSGISEATYNSNVRVCWFQWKPNRFALRVILLSKIT